MRFSGKVALVILLSLGAIQTRAQSPPFQTLNSTDPVSTGPSKINFNDGYLFKNRVGRWTGTGAPGSIPFSIQGDLYFDTAAQLSYACYSVICSSSPTWKLAGAGAQVYPGVGIGVSTGSAWGTSYSLATLTAALGACATGTQGMVPATGGGTVNFLRADCTFAAPPSQTYPGAGIPLSTGSAWSTSYSLASLTAALGACSSSLQGLVPSTGGGTSNFLRADCTFAAPPGSSYTAGSGINIVSNVISTVAPSAQNGTVQSGSLWGVTTTGGTGANAAITGTGNPQMTAYAGTPSQPITLIVPSGVTSIGSIDIDSVGAKNAYLGDGITTPVPTTSGMAYNFQYNANLNSSAGGWQCVSANCAAGGSSTVPGEGYYPSVVDYIVANSNGQGIWSNSGVTNCQPAGAWGTGAVASTTVFYSVPNTCWLQFNLVLPSPWNGNFTFTLFHTMGTLSSGGADTESIAVQTFCLTPGVTDLSATQTFNAASTIATTWSGTMYKTGLYSAVTPATTGCSAGRHMTIRITETVSAGTDSGQFIGAYVLLH